MSGSGPGGAEESREILAERRSQDVPLLSICIPQYDRTSFFLRALQSYDEQIFRDFEICISDDRSGDGRQNEILDYLRGGRSAYVYARRQSNGRYDKNLRSALSLARGRYALLMGNDDLLPDTGALERIARFLRETDAPGGIGVLIVNYRDIGTGVEYRRARSTGVMGRGPAAAAGAYRNFSFVSGVALRVEDAQRMATAKWDGSEMYQMYIGCRIVASGASLAGIDEPLIGRGIRIPGQEVDSYLRRPREDSPVRERRLPLSDLCALVCDALRGDGGVEEGVRRRCVWTVIRQFLIFTYPFWIMEYKRTQGWKYALGVCLGMRPRYLLREAGAGPLLACAVRSLYAIVTLSGLLIPHPAFFALKGRLYELAKNSA